MCIYLYAKFGVNTKHLKSIFTSSFLFREKNKAYYERKGLIVR